MSNELGATAILLVCRNRRETTLRALRSIARQCDSTGWHVVLFDDASTDGTAEAVAKQFPDTILVHGDGNAFWNGGLHRAWSRALEEPVDAFLWLNDDVELDDDALSRLGTAYRSMRESTGDDAFILVGATRGAGDEVTYGGLVREPSPVALRLRPARGMQGLTRVDTFNGNIVLVPRAVVNRIGINDPAFFHNWGDVDYGLRATRAGINVMLLDGTLGRCEINVTKRESGFGAAGLPLREQWRKVNGHHGLPFASWWRMTRRHSGAWWPLHFLLPYRKLLLPSFSRRRGPGA